MHYTEFFLLLSSSSLIHWMYLLVVCSTAYSDPMFDLSHSSQSLNTCSSNISTEVQISSQCRQLCVEDATCVAFYTYPFSYRWRCFLFLYGTPHRWSNSTMPNDISGVKIFPGSTMEADGFYYALLNKHSLNFTYAREDCKKFPGFRLALIKTTQSYDIAIPKYQQGGVYNGLASDWVLVVIDLQQNIGNMNATYGDGTPFENSQVASSGKQLTYDNTPTLDRKVFVLWNGFNDVIADRPFIALCQGDPLMIMP